MAKRHVGFAGLVAAVGLALAGVLIASPPSGVMGFVVARARFVDPVDLKLKLDSGSQEVIHVPDAQETVMQQILIAPGGHTGWHSHPGPVVVLVKSGTLTFYSSEDPLCQPRDYTAGQAFVDTGQGHVHIARNEQETNVELWATYFDVPAGGAFRIDVAVPGNCPF